MDEADIIEDVFMPGLYASVLNQAFNLPTVHQISADKLMKAENGRTRPTRLVKKAEAYFRSLPPELPEFDHFTPPWLLRNPNMLDGDSSDVVKTLERARLVIDALNNTGLGSGESRVVP